MKRNIVPFFGLSVKWQEEALTNMDKRTAMDTLFIEPLETDIPGKHILWDLSECMVCNPKHNTGIIPVSNTIAMKVYFSDCMNYCVLKPIS
jgi:hypothetical protein